MTLLGHRDDLIEKGRKTKDQGDESWKRKNQCNERER